jgi:glycerol uptake facilitator-like aquaporin
MNGDLGRRVVAQAVGTMLLLAGVVGSGIMGARLAGGNVALALLANTLATGAVLLALILTLGAVSGAHFNPAVTLAAPARAATDTFTGIRPADVPAFVAAQLIAAAAATMLTAWLLPAPAGAEPDTAGTRDREETSR